MIKDKIKTNPAFVCLPFKAIQALVDTPINCCTAKYLTQRQQHFIQPPTPGPCIQVYLPIFQTAGSVELALSMFGEHGAMYEAEEDPAKRGQHEAALRRAISTDVTVSEALSEVWELGIWLVRQLLGPSREANMAWTVQVRAFMRVRACVSLRQYLNRRCCCRVFSVFCGC